MKHIIIKTDKYLLILDDSNKEGDYTYHESANLVSRFNNAYSKKIIAHLPLNESPILEGVDLLPSLVKIEYDVIGQPMVDYMKDKHNEDECIGFIDGYEKAREKYKWTDDDMKIMYNMSCGHIGLDLLPDQTKNNERFSSFLQSLSSPKIPIAFDCELHVIRWMLRSKEHKIKTVTNSQGNKVWMGKYIYA